MGDGKENNLGEQCKNKSLGGVRVQKTKFQEERHRETQETKEAKVKKEIDKTMDNKHGETNKHGEHREEYKYRSNRG